MDEGALRASRAQRSCTGVADCCRFRLTGETPHVTLGEAWMAWKAWRAAGRTRVELPPDGKLPISERAGEVHDLPGKAAGVAAPISACLRVGPCPGGK